MSEQRVFFKLGKTRERERINTKQALRKDCISMAFYFPQIR